MSDAEWAFGDGGFGKVYGDRLEGSSLLDCAVATRWVFLFMLAKADSHGRFRCASIAGLARRAAVSHEDAKAAVDELEAPDPDSTTKTDDGRRIRPVDGGWEIVNHDLYRNFRGEQQKRDAERQARKRERDKQRDVTVTSRDIRTRHQMPDVRYQIPDTREKTGGNGTAPQAAPAEGSTATPSPARVAKTFWWDQEKKRIWGTAEAREKIRAKWVARGLSPEEFQSQLKGLDGWLEDRPGKRRVGTSFANRINNWMNKHLVWKEERESQ